MNCRECAQHSILELCDILSDGLAKIAGSYVHEHELHIAAAPKTSMKGKTSWQDN